MDPPYLSPDSKNTIVSDVGCGMYGIECRVRMHTSVFFIEMSACAAPFGVEGCRSPQAKNFS